MHFCETRKNLERDTSNDTSSLCPGGAQCYDQLKQIKYNREFADDLGLGRPSTSTNKAHVIKVNGIVSSNRELTFRGIAEECNLGDRITK